MEIITSIETRISDRTAVTVGKFDGLHLGHELLIARLLEQESRGLRSLVLTFDASPRVALEQQAARQLVTNGERAHILEGQGLSYCAQLPFEREIRNLEPEDFIARLVENYRMGYFVCGTDFRFGAKGRGDLGLLRRLSQELGFELEVVDKLQQDNRDVSSTYVREAIAAGNVQKASELLGYDYFIYGQVVHGNHLGHKIGIPTINLLPPQDKLLPAYGVYVTKVELEGRIYHGVTNIGVKPSIEGSYPVGVETHILDFRRDVYDKAVRVNFCKFLRPERKFASVDELCAQMRSDCAQARDWFNAHG